MESLLTKLAAALQPFHHLDPTGWFAFSGLLGPLAAWLCLALGLAAAAVGGRKLVFRFVAAPLGVLLGILLTSTISHLLADVPHVPVKLIAFALPFVLGVLCAIVPEAIVFVATGLLGALAGMTVVAEHEILVGAVPGFFLAGVLGIVFGQFLAKILSAALGALLVAGAVIALGRGHAVGNLLLGSAWSPVILAALVFVLGAALQLVTHKDDEERARLRAAAEEKKQRAKDDKARAGRFADYGNKR